MSPTVMRNAANASASTTSVPRTSMVWDRPPTETWSMVAVGRNRPGPRTSFGRYADGTMQPDA